MGYLVVFIGAGIGGVLRHAVGWASLRWLGPVFPYSTLIVNILGSALMGLLMGLLAERTVPDQNVRLFLATGILGGFTTFSTFSLDTITLWQRGQTVACIGYVAVSMVASFGALCGMLFLVRGLGR